MMMAKTGSGLFNRGGNGADLILEWEKTRVRIPIVGLAK